MGEAGKQKRGGARSGAGRKSRGETKAVMFKLPIATIEQLRILSERLAKPQVRIVEDLIDQASSDFTDTF